MTPSGPDAAGIDMRWHWVRNAVRDGTTDEYGARANTALAHYFFECLSNSISCWCPSSSLEA
jgi:hypothetical protein